MSALRNAHTLLLGLLLSVALPLMASASSGGGTHAATSESPIPEPTALLVFAAGALVVRYGIKRHNSDS
jgi:hypothetical protein